MECIALVGMAWGTQALSTHTTTEVHLRCQPGYVIRYVGKLPCKYVWNLPQAYEYHEYMKIKSSNLYGWRKRTESVSAYDAPPFP
jgi:hypothetical protein